MASSARSGLKAPHAVLSLGLGTEDDTEVNTHASQLSDQPTIRTDTEEKLLRSSVFCVNGEMELQFLRRSDGGAVAARVCVFFIRSEV